MKVSVRIAGLVRRPKGLNLNAIELPDGATSADLFAVLGFNELERRALRLDRGPELLRPQTVLQDGDALVLYAMIGGG